MLITWKEKIFQLYFRLSRSISLRMRFPSMPVVSLKGRMMWFLCGVLRLFLPYWYFSRKRELIMGKYPFGCSRSIVFPWSLDKRNKLGWYRNIFPYEYFKTTVEVPFEDGTINIPVDYDGYLRQDFGDYMKMPPENERKTHHAEGSIIDLDRPYTYYVELKKAGKL